jgi:putative transposase
MIVQKAYKYRFFPTESQKQQLTRTFGCARLVWNQALEDLPGNKEVPELCANYQCPDPVEERTGKAFLKEVSSVVLQQSLRVSISAI